MSDVRRRTPGPIVPARGESASAPAFSPRPFTTGAEPILSLDEFLARAERQPDMNVILAGDGLTEHAAPPPPHVSPAPAEGIRHVRPLMFASILMLFLGLGVLGAERISSIRGEVLGESSDGLAAAMRAVEHLSSARFADSAADFSAAHRSFANATDAIGFIGNELAKASRFLPGLSKISSGQGALEGARHLAAAGEAMSGMLALLPEPGATGAGLAGADTSFLSLATDAEEFAKTASRELALAEESFSRVDEADIPEDKREAFALLRSNLPTVRTAVAGFGENGRLVRDLLGENGPRLYLFLFQNNHELRPTGGFIGSYGLLEVTHGHVRKFFIDGIFNPDGQFKEDIIPPAPIRKVSAGWSLHDSNWWPDFPTSAEKAIVFYEKTGGPTVDGVVTLTPSAIEDLLRLTGPIELPEYGVSIDADNFMEAVQEEVEVKYDKELNQPKKILSDLAPLLLERLFQTKSADSVLAIVGGLSKGLSERQILLYSRNAEVERLIDKAGWSGRLLGTSGDYASVVHTNLNGYKTDGVIDESIEHKAAIQADGSVLDTIRITRKHRGGNTPYEWWNKVNSDYMRVYVPEGSELLSAKGHTYEFPKAPIDYDALGFRPDPDVEREERETTIHETGTRISVESGKTVFGNWVYVSPGESVTVEYVYRLPFVVDPREDEPASYSLLFQKQSGSVGSGLRHTLSFPESYTPIWDSGDAVSGETERSFEKRLTTDVFFGTVFTGR